ncbi:MAG: hypothetical protein WAU28_04325 [Candidatus Moraniibacteriota bacterium]
MGFESKMLKKMFENDPTMERRRSVELVASRLREKYKYEDLSSFVGYLESMEVFFLEVESRHENGRQLKEEMIQTEIYLMASSLHIDQQILSDIYGKFQSLTTTVADVHAIIEQLLSEYEEKDCQIFIRYLRDITVIFLGYQEERVLTSTEIRAIIRESTKAKMKMLSADGTPDLSMLTQIQSEFFAELEKE